MVRHYHCDLIPEGHVCMDETPCEVCYERNDFTDADAERQDIVDGKIHHFLEDLFGVEIDVIEWGDTSFLSEIRETIQECMLGKLNISELEFYPYRVHPHIGPEEEEEVCNE